MGFEDGVFHMDGGDDLPAILEHSAPTVMRILPNADARRIADPGSLRPLDTFSDVSRAAASLGLRAGQPELWTARIT